jgi:hypothetical protein
MSELDTLQNIPIVTAATALDNPDGSTFILILHQALYLGDKIENTLLCPNQLRYYGIDVDDIPIHLAPKNKPSTHSIRATEDDFNIPLSLNGIISYFQTRTPTRQELDTCKWITLTNPNTWEPHSENFSYNEEIALTRQHMNYTPCNRSVYAIQTTDLNEISSVYDDTNILDISHEIAATSSSQKTPRVTPVPLAQRWGIGVEAAKQTLKFTTQKGVRYTIGPPERRYRTKQAQLCYRQLSGRHGRFYTDTMFASAKTISGKKIAQIYAYDLVFSKIYPMKLKSEKADTILALIHEVGVPYTIHSDDAKEITEGKFKQLCSDYSILCTLAEPYSPWQNRAESNIRELKRHVSRKMKARNVHKALWDYCARWSCDVHSKTSTKLFVLDGRTPYEAVTGDTPDISSIMAYDFYEPVWYYDKIAAFPEPKRHIGRWLGQSYNIGQAMCYWILPLSGIPIAQSTVTPLSHEDQTLESVQQELITFDQQIKSKYCKDDDNIEGNPIDNKMYPTFDNEDHITPEFESIEETTLEADNWDHNAYDQYIAAEVILPVGEHSMLGKVIERKRDRDGNPIGQAHSNPLLDTRIYQVEFPDGHCEEYSANTIAKCLCS